MTLLSSASEPEKMGRLSQSHAAHHASGRASQMHQFGKPPPAYVHPTEDAAEHARQQQLAILDEELEDIAAQISAKKQELQKVERFLRYDK